MFDWLLNPHRKGNPTPPDEFETSRQQHYLTDAGHEVPDPVPMAPPVGYKKQPSMVENIRNMVRSEMLMREAAARGFETFEESEDFGEDDDDRLPVTAYEAVFDPQSPAPPSDGPPATPPPGPPEGSPEGGSAVSTTTSEVKPSSSTPTSPPPAGLPS